MAQREPGPTQLVVPQRHASRRGGEDDVGGSNSGVSSSSSSSGLLNGGGSHMNTSAAFSKNLPPVRPRGNITYSAGAVAGRRERVNIGTTNFARSLSDSNVNDQLAGANSRPYHPGIVPRSGDTGSQVKSYVRKTTASRNSHLKKASPEDIKQKREALENLRIEFGASYDASDGYHGPVCVPHDSSGVQEVGVPTRFSVRPPPHDTLKMLAPSPGDPGFSTDIHRFRTTNQDVKDPFNLFTQEKYARASRMHARLSRMRDHMDDHHAANARAHEDAVGRAQSSVEAIKELRAGYTNAVNTRSVHGHQAERPPLPAPPGTCSRFDNPGAAPPSIPQAYVPSHYETGNLIY